MPVQTDHLADEIKEIKTGLDVLRTDLAGFKGSVETELKYIHAAASSLVRVLTGATIAILAGDAGIIWNASALNHEVKQHGIRIDKRDERFDKVDGRLDQLSSEVKQQDPGLDRFEQRFDKVDQQLGQILQRLDQVVPKSK